MRSLTEGQIGVVLGVPESRGGRPPLLIVVKASITPDAEPVRSGNVLRASERSSKYGGRKGIGFEVSESLDGSFGEFGKG
jgi:hypothetical protein